MINTDLLPNLFIWDNNIDYELNIGLGWTNFVTWSVMPTRCYVTGGFLNTKGTNPSCSMKSMYVFTVRGFQKILTQISGSYIIKIELDITTDQTTPNYVTASTIDFYANSDANVNLR